MFVTTFACDHGQSTLHFGLVDFFTIWPLTCESNGSSITFSSCLGDNKIFALFVNCDAECVHKKKCVAGVPNL